MEELVVDGNVDGVRVRSETQQARIRRVVFQQSDHVGGDDQRLTTNVEVDGGQRPRAELRRTAEQRLYARLCREIKHDDGSILSGADQLILRVHR